MYLSMSRSQGEGHIVLNVNKLHFISFRNKPDVNININFNIKFIFNE